MDKPFGGDLRGIPAFSIKIFCRGKASRRPFDKLRALNLPKGLLTAEYAPGRFT